jgi:hypothetical protein
MSDYAGRIISATEPTVTTTSASGVWTLEEALKYKKAGTWPTTFKDPNFNQTVLLLHGDGTNGAQNNTFLDSSTNNFTITRNGNTTQGTFSPFSVGAGEWSNYFDGNTDYLSYPDNTAFQFGTGEFTVEAWVYPTATPGVDYTHIVGSQEYGLSGTWVLGIDTNLNLRIFASALNGTGSATATGGTVPLNTWSYVAMVRSGSTLKGYVNGVEVCSVANSANINSAGYVGTIGADTNGDEAAFTGYISNVRIVKGGALNVTSVPTSPFTTTVSSGTVSLLTCQSNRFVDNSTNNFTITRNGDVRVTPFSPFAPYAAYSAGTNGGSGYFDGTGDYLTAASNAAFGYGSGDFTIEYWCYPTSFGVTNIQLDQRTSGATEIVPTLYTDSASGTLFYFVNGANRIGGSNLTLNTWQHIAVSRSGTSTRLFVNGTQVGSTYTDNNTYATSLVSIGAYSPGASLFFNGYISSVRIVKGTAVYTSAFTPPTAPLTAITNTSLLCNFTNAGVFDNTGKNVLETVGNAQIDTAVKKYGTGSLEFDGTGDWLIVPNSTDIQLGTGNFTIEFWVYLNATGAARGFVGKGGASTGWLVSLVSTNTVRFTYGSSTITSTGTLSGSTWHHIAVVREGTGSNQTKIYINGTNDGTGTVSTDFNQTEVMYIGANRTGGDALNGFIDDLRITKGVARYTTNFTAPTAPFQDQ